MSHTTVIESFSYYKSGSVRDICLYRLKCLCRAVTTQCCTLARTHRSTVTSPLILDLMQSHLQFLALQPRFLLASHYHFLLLAFLGGSPHASNNVGCLSHDQISCALSDYCTPAIKVRGQLGLWCSGLV